MLNKYESDYIYPKAFNLIDTLYPKIFADAIYLLLIYVKQLDSAGGYGKVYNNLVVFVELSYSYIYFSS